MFDILVGDEEEFPQPFLLISHVAGGELHVNVALRASRAREQVVDLNELVSPEHRHFIPESRSVNCAF